MECMGLRTGGDRNDVMGIKGDRGLGGPLLPPSFPPSQSHSDKGKGREKTLRDIRKWKVTDDKGEIETVVEKPMTRGNNGKGKNREMGVGSDGRMMT